MHKYFLRTTYVLLIAISFLQINCTPKKSISSFEKTYGSGATNFGWSVIEAKDGNYVMLGESRMFESGTDNILLLKSDENGNILWEKSFGDNGNDNGRSLLETPDGGFILFGSVYTFTGTGWDMSLIKTDSDGNKVWGREYGSDKREKGFCVRQTSDGGYIMLGQTDSFGFGGSDLFLVKTDSDGVEEWSNTFGGKGNDYGSSVLQTADGGYIMIGKSASFSSGWDSYMVKADSDGDEVWSKTISTAKDDYSNSLLQTADGGYIVLVCFWDVKAGKWKLSLLKTDDYGEVKWSKIYSSSSDAFGNSVSQTSDGGYVILGKTKSSDKKSWDMYLIKTDSNGDTLWEKRYGENLDNEYGVSVVETTDGGYLLYGYSEYYRSRKVEMYLIKTDNNGRILH